MCKMGHFASSFFVKKTQELRFQIIRTFARFACTQPSVFYFEKKASTEAQNELFVLFFQKLQRAVDTSIALLTAFQRLRQHALPIRVVATDSHQLLVNITVPAEICIDGLVEDIHHISAAHGDMMLESVLADEFHQLLQVVNLRNGDATIHTVRIVRDLSLAQISLDAALRVVGREAEERKRSFRHLGVDGSESLDLAQCAA